MARRTLYVNEEGANQGSRVQVPHSSESRVLFTLGFGRSLDWLSIVPNLHQGKR
jgi:hypothetical protein